MRKRILYLLAPALMMFGCQNKPQEPVTEPEPMTAAELKAVIQGLEDTLAMAYNNKDVELFSRFYAENAVTYGEGREQLFGKPELVNHFRSTAMMDSSGRKFEYLTIDVFHAGDLAVENGKWIQTDSSGTEKDHGFYMVVFRKIDGKWQSIRDMWNSSIMDVPEDETVPEA